MDFSLEPLEYDRLKKLIGRYIRGSAAEGLLAAMRPTTDLQELESRHALNGEAMEYLGENQVPFADLPLLPAVLARLSVAGITLTIEEVEVVQDFLYEAGAFGTRWQDDAEDFSRLRKKARAFPNLKSLGTQLGRAVRGGEIEEDYSPTLKRVRRDFEKARGRLNRKLESIIKSAEFAPQLQEQLVTIRNGRYVIPVRAEEKRSVQGIVHGSSSSGATVFMEPLDTLEMNNDLVRLQEEEQREVQRILGELTDRIQESAEELGQAAGLWAEMEVLFGVAQYGRDFDCVVPQFSEGDLRLVAARHPLLDEGLRSRGQAVVPLKLEMDLDERVLVISGPNAGGKTVVLKTLGLLSLMAQSGIPVPAEEAVVPVMDCVLADIGDRQSIANQLSTFSAHVLTISQMVDSVSEQSLILLDEIGSSTEPAEGAALATAVLEHFRNVGSLTVATTHYNRLKMYAETTGGVRNAAMEFNEATLEPTYQLIDGLSGQSSGLKIAERLRLPSELIEKARASLDRTELDAARYVEELKVRVSSLEKDKLELETERREFQDWQSKTSARIEEERRQEMDRIEERLDDIIQEIRNQAADELRAVGQQATKRFSKKLERIGAEASRDIRRQRRPNVREESSASKAAAEPPQEGARVRVLSLGVDGSVSHVFATEVEVRVGSMKVRRPFDDVEVVSSSIELPKGVQFDFSKKQLDSTEINLIGCSSEEALDRLDKFLDDAFLTEVPTVRIVHGHGMGILRRAIAEFLESHANVSRFEPAPQNQGGAGATIAYLED